MHSSRAPVCTRMSRPAFTKSVSLLLQEEVEVRPRCAEARAAALPAPGAGR